MSKYNWAWPAVGTVLKEEGFPALYKGFLPKVLRLGPGGMSPFPPLCSAGAFATDNKYRRYSPGRLPRHYGFLPQDAGRQGIRDCRQFVFIFVCFWFSGCTDSCTNVRHEALLWMIFLVQPLVFGYILSCISFGCGTYDVRWRKPKKNRTSKYTQTRVIELACTEHIAKARCHSVIGTTS